MIPPTIRFLAWSPCAAVCGSGTVGAVCASKCPPGQSSRLPRRALPLTSAPCRSGEVCFFNAQGVFKRRFRKPGHTNTLYSRVNRVPEHISSEHKSWYWLTVLHCTGAGDPFCTRVSSRMKYVLEHSSPVNMIRGLSVT